jgi:hypothetical protein
MFDRWKFPHGEIMDRKDKPSPSERYVNSSGLVFRGGTRSPTNLVPRPFKDEGKLSVRSSISNNCLPAFCVLRPKESFVVIDVRKLPSAAKVIYDAAPDHHASLFEIPLEEVSAAVVDSGKMREAQAWEETEWFKNYSNSIPNIFRP